MIPSGIFTGPGPQGAAEGDPINALWFGADGNGSTDDTYAVFRTVKMAADLGRRAYFPAGTYRMTWLVEYDWANTAGSLYVLGETRGRGPSGTVFRWDGAAGGTVFKFTGANSVVLDSVLVNGNGLADRLVWFENAAGAVGSSDIALVNSEFFNGRQTSKSVGVQFGSTNFQVSEVRVDRCFFQAVYYGILSFTANVKNFTIRDSGTSLCFWGIAHGSPDLGASLSGHFLVQGVNFGQSGNVAGGFFNGVAGNVDVGGDLFMADGVVVGCESEGSARFVNAPGNIGTNYGHVSLIGNHFEVSANVPADDFVIQTGGALTMIGNFFQNGRIAGAVPKVKCFGFASRIPTVDAQSLGIVSIGNWYQNAAVQAPLYDGGGNLLTDSLTNGSLNRGSVMSQGDLGGTGGAILSLEEVNLTGSAGMARLTRANDATVTPRYSGLLSVGVNKLTVPFTAAAFVIANTTARCTAWTIPAKTKITNVVADTTTPFAGLAGTISLKVGDGTGTEDQFILSHDVKTAPVTKGLVNGDLGAGLAAATASQGGAYYWAAGLLRLVLISGAGNIGTGAATNLTQGSVDVYVTVERMP